MTKRPQTSIAIAPEAKDNALSKAQQTFNRLIKQIEQRRAKLLEWESATPRIQDKVVDQLMPLTKKMEDMLGRFVHGLHDAYAQKGLTKTERRLISEIIAEIAGDLAEKLDDAELKAIYNQHADSDLDEEAADELDMMKQAMEDAFGVDIPEDAASFEDISAHVREQIEQQQKAWAAGKEHHRSKRKKTAKQVAAEEKARAAEEQINLSLREVYRKLASSLHPDRETDAAERERKTALMQRVNQAYEKKDLLKLLELQLELEHIDQATINNIGESRLQHYNKILKEQLGELDVELMHVQGRFCEQFNLPPFAAPTPKAAERSLSDEIARLKRFLRILEADALLCQDIKKVKANVRRWHEEIMPPDFDDMMLDDIRF